ncbi:MAG TPA: response regulator transcription factor [Gemmatimonadaceae bacterium]|nr:response regulator transcription factor [Gemmatimonadaceae bacterium]
MRLLVVEDDGRLADLLARSLRELGYAVDVVGDGEAALVQAALNQYDGVILDIQLPRLDGLAVCRELRKRGNPVPILMLTARDAVHDRIAGLDAGADDYLAKPFDLQELHARVRALLRRMPAIAPTQLNIGDLVVDTAAQTATRGGEPVMLTTKEFVMLEYLARNAGRVVGRAEIVGHVWDDNHDPLTNAVEVYINRLRKKIDSGRPPLIHTRRGAGYILTDRAESDAATAGD